MQFNDLDGNPVTAGDTIVFCYGIPPVRVEAKIAEADGEIWAMTPGHKPDRCKLKELRKHVGEFHKLQPARQQLADPSDKWDRRAALDAKERKE
jgi:hypothetical protein